MIGTIQVLCALLLAIVTSGKQHPKCSPPPAPAKAELQSFFILQDEPTIPADASCAWDLTSESFQNILVYIFLSGKATENQCIYVRDIRANSGGDICGVKDSNIFLSSTKNVTISYPKKEGKTEAVPNFQILYKYEYDYVCGYPPPLATVREESIDAVRFGSDMLPMTRCTWYIIAPESQRLMVYLLTEGTEAARQCVHVTDKNADKKADLCGVNGSNTFTSVSSEVVVFLERKEPIYGFVPNFKIMYTIAINEKCANPPNPATGQVQSFDVLRDEKIIAAGTKCLWNITAPESQKVMVYLSTEGTEAAKQCVHVKDTSTNKEAEICGVNGSNTFESTGQAVMLTYPKFTGEPEEVPNFKIVYMAVKVEKCANPPPQATGEVQFFDVVQNETTIAADQKCSWTITAPKSQKLLIYLSTVGTEAEKQCVHVKDTSGNKEADICGLNNWNTFRSTGQTVTVTYPKLHGAIDQVPNFKIMYMIETGGVRRSAPWITVMSSVFMLSQILLP